MSWAEAAALPLALLTPEMHFRSLVDAAFADAGVQPQAAMETNSVLALLMAVQGSPLAAVLPGALVSVARSQSGLQARPLVAPALRTPIAWLTAATGRPTLALQAALALARQPDWQALVAAHSGTLGAATA
jgi:DNA-binding transcriptional LysR family regulator